jgi:hypothetical protein
MSITIFQVVSIGTLGHQKVSQKTTEHYLLLTGSNPVNVQQEVGFPIY